MPNIVTTRCSVKGPAADLKKFVKTYFQEPGEFKFRNIIPSPQVVLDTMMPEPGQGGPAEAVGDNEVELMAQALLSSFPEGESIAQFYNPKIKTHKDIIEFVRAQRPQVEFWARRSLLCAAETGYPGWYSWRCAHWGTKWDCFGIKLISTDPVVFKFDTAWIFPLPIFEKLQEIYPSLMFETMSFDEGWNEATIGRFGPGISEILVLEASDELHKRVCEEVYALVYGYEM